jgi:hypothetical protein
VEVMASFTFNIKTSYPHKEKKKKKKKKDIQLHPTREQIVLLEDSRVASQIQEHKECQQSLAPETPGVCLQPIKRKEKRSKKMA